MSKLILLLFAFVFTVNGKVNANDSCQIILNKRVIFRGEADQQNAVLFIEAKQFKKGDYLTLRYCSENESKGWNRTFYLNDANDENLKTIELSKQSGSASIDASVLNKQIEKRAPVFIYTMSLPTDKKLAARIRARRIFMCKIEWN